MSQPPLLPSTPELMYLKKGTLLFKGTRNTEGRNLLESGTPDVTKTAMWDVTTDRPSNYYWFALDHKVAEAYTRPSSAPPGYVHVYKINDHAVLFHLWNKTNISITQNVLAAVENTINTQYANFLNQDTKRGLLLSLHTGAGLAKTMDTLKIPLGFIPSYDQNKQLVSADATLNEPKAMYSINTDPSNSRFISQCPVAQRMSQHIPDKYLVEFIRAYKDEIFRYIILNKKDGDWNSPNYDIAARDNIINTYKQYIRGYMADEWPTIWHSPSFNSELCLIDPKTYTTYLGRYQIDGTNYKWYPDGRDITARPDILTEAGLLNLLNSMPGGGRKQKMKKGGTVPGTQDPYKQNNQLFSALQSSQPAKAMENNFEKAFNTTISTSEINPNTVLIDPSEDDNLNKIVLKHQAIYNYKLQEEIEKARAINPCVPCHAGFKCAGAEASQAAGAPKPQKKKGLKKKST